MTDKVIPFNPLDKKNLGGMVAEALLDSPVHPLGGLPAFRGAGIYSLYYTGDFPEYEPIARANRGDAFRVPIYVGKAIPEGGRKGKIIEDANTTRALSKRLGQHAKRIKAAASTLKLEDFYCRHLVLDDVWIPLGESLLISRFQPLWNIRVDGFGNNVLGKGRPDQVMSRWDCLHPGRPLSSKSREESVEDIKRDITDFLRQAPFECLSQDFVQPDARSSPGPVAAPPAAEK